MFSSLNDFISCWALVRKKTVLHLESRDSLPSVIAFTRAEYLVSYTSLLSAAVFSATVMVCWGEFANVRLSSANTSTMYAVALSEAFHLRVALSSPTFLASTSTGDRLRGNTISVISSATSLQDVRAANASPNTI